MQDVENVVLTIRNFFCDLPKLYEQNSNDIDLCDKETQDLLHLIELTTFNASKGYQLSKELQKVRNKRRLLKDENELLEPLMNVINKYKNVENELNRCLGDVRKIKKRHEVRTYKMRVRDESIG